MRKLLSIILAITILISMATVAVADGIDGSMHKAKIKVATSVDFKPFEYYDENGELTGFDIDLMNYIGEKIGYDIEYVEFTFDRLLPAVASGEVDCAISGIAITEQRDGIIDYTRPYLTANVTYEGEESVEKYGIVFPANSAAKAKVIEASGDPYPSLYMLVDNAILSLKKDGSILKLIEKYGLNSIINNDENYKITYSSIVTIEDTQSDGRPADGVSEENTVANIPRYETWEEIGLTNPYPSDWAKDSIVKAQDLGITPKGKVYNFHGPITREEFCELAYNYVSEFGNLTVDDGHIAFKDTNNVKIQVLNAMGIINGKSETEFAPNDLLTREEAATILNRLINVVHADLASTELYFEFADSAQISDWAMSAIQRICNIGIMKGVGNNNFAPQENYTTEQAIVTLVRVYANSGVSKNITGGADAPTDIVVSSDAEYVLKIIDKDGNIILNDNDILSCAAMEGELTEGGGNEWFLELMLSEEGRNKFRVATKKVSEYPAGENYLAILVNDQVITNPAVMEEIDSEGLFITGDFTEESAKALETTINNGIYK